MSGPLPTLHAEARQPRRVFEGVPGFEKDDVVDFDCRAVVAELYRYRPRVQDQSKKISHLCKLRGGWSFLY